MGNASSSSLFSSFYTRTALLCLGLILLGFSPTTLARANSEIGFSPALLAHAVTWTGWYCLLIYQAMLITGRNHKRHKAIGQVATVLMVVMLITLIMIIPESYARGVPDFIPFTSEHFIMLPIMDLCIMVPFFSLAILNRKKADVHKHFIIVGSILLMDPAIGRLSLQIGIPPLGMVAHFLLLGAVIWHDRKKVGAIHWVTKVGIAVLAARYACFFIVGPSESWAAFVKAMLG